MLSKYSHQKKSIMQTLKPPRHLPVMPISLYLWSIPLRTGTKSQEHHSRLPKVNWRGYCMVGQPPPPGILTILIHRPSPWTSFTGVGMVAGFAMSGLYTNSAEEWQKMSFSHSLHFGQKTMTGAYIPCAYQQGIVHDAPLLLGNGGGEGSNHLIPFPLLLSVPPRTPPCILPGSHLLPSPSII